MPAKLYTLLAFISFVLDIISFFAVYGLLAAFINDFEDFGVVLQNTNQVSLADAADDIVDLFLTAANPYLGRIVVIMLYTACDIVFVIWVIHFRSRMGEQEHKALLGFGNEMRIAFGVNPKGNNTRSGSSKPSDSAKTAAQRHRNNRT